MKTEIEEILKRTLPSKSYSLVKEGLLMGEPYMRIEFAVSDFNINNVQGQKPQLVSLMLFTNTLEIRPQVFGCNGGQHIYRMPDMADPKEKYLAMKSIKIPFRKPLQVKANVLTAIERFAENWVRLLKENKEFLMYSNIVNYDEFLNS